MRLPRGTEIFSLRGKNALITGATGHLGVATARAFAEAGANVLVNSRSSVRAKSIVDMLQSEGYLAEVASFDVTVEDAVNQFSCTLASQPLSVIVNNAYWGGGGAIEDCGSNCYRDSYDLAVVASQYLVKSLLPNLRNAVSLHGDASVINVASMYATVAPDRRIYSSPATVNPPYYGAAKAALLQWSRYAACEFGHEHIRFNTISPGPFPSLVTQRDYPSFINKLEDKVPLGRIGSPDEIKGPMLFLASPASSYVNGANIAVDGGWTAW